MLFIVTWVPALDGCEQLVELLRCDHWSLAGQVIWSTLHRPMWGIWICWVILACSNGYGGNGYITFIYYLLLLLLLFVSRAVLPNQHFKSDFTDMFAFNSETRLLV